MRLDMDLSPFQVEVVVSSTILAAAISSFFWGHHAMDEWGRKKTLMVASTIFVIGSAIMGAAVGPYHKGYSMLIVGRIVVGVAIGLASEAGPLYISECAPPALRGKLTTLFNIAVVGGQVFAAVLCGCLSYLPASYNWRIMLAFGAVPAIAQLVGFLTLPLSPTWLVLKGRQEEAEIVLRQIRSVPVATVEISDGEELVDPVHEELQAIVDEYEASKKQQHMSLCRLWRGRAYPTIRRAMVVGCSLWAVSMYSWYSNVSWMLDSSSRHLTILPVSTIGSQYQVSQLAGINTIMYYGASIVRKAGLDGDRSFDIWITVPLYCMQLFGILVCFRIVDRWGRRPTLFLSMTSVLFSLLVIGTGFATENGVMTIAGMFLYLFAFGTGLSTMPYIMNAELFPTEYRGLCVAQSTGVFWSTNFLVSLTFLTIAHRIGNAGVFFMYAAIVFVSEIYFYFVVPETSGLSFHQIQDMMLLGTTTTSSKEAQAIANSVETAETTDYGTEVTRIESSGVVPQIC